MNPNYRDYKNIQNQMPFTALQQALAVVSNMQDYEKLEQVVKDISLSMETEIAIQKMQEPSIYQQVGLSSDAMLNALGTICCKHEIPMGMIHKLMKLTEYDTLEFIIDDSSSMNEPSGTAAEGYRQTRWQEALSRLKEMVEILAHVPTPPINVRFLNREDILQFQHRGQTPEIFIQTTYQQLDRVFANRPIGSTPIYNCLKKSFDEGCGKRIARYLFCDGEPDGGATTKQAIQQMIIKRTNAYGNPFTFLSCTDKDQEAEWMKEVEEAARYCTEYDDFNTEAKEVLLNQGEALPFTKGFYLICQIVGAMNPDDLDAMDESVPLTKWALDNLLGFKTNEQSYRYYFKKFKEAQSKRKIVNSADRIKVYQNWEPYFDEFIRQPTASNIEAVRVFRKQLKQGFLNDLPTFWLSSDPLFNILFFRA